MKVIRPSSWSLILEMEPVVPLKSNHLSLLREYDQEMYKKRNGVERLFRRLKGFRRIFQGLEDWTCLFRFFSFRVDLWIG